MQVLVSSDHHIEASHDFMTSIGKRVEEKIKRFEDHLTRVEVHLSDEHAHKGGAQAASTRAPWAISCRAASSRCSRSAAP